jgi:hypothetical protein
MTRTTAPWLILAVAFLVFVGFCIRIGVQRTRVNDAFITARQMALFAAKVDRLPNDVAELAAWVSKIEHSSGNFRWIERTETRVAWGMEYRDLAKRLPVFLTDKQALEGTVRELNERFYAFYNACRASPNSRR